MNSTELARIEQPIATRANTDEKLIDLFLRGKKSPRTVETYTIALRQFLNFVNQLPLQQLKIDDLQAYADYLRITYTSAHTRKLKLNAVKSLLTFATKVGYLRFNVGAAVEADAANTIVEDKILPESQIVGLLTLVENKRDNLLIRLLYATGGRVSELCGLTWGDVTEDYVIFRYTKSGKPRRIKLSDDCMAHLQVFRPIGARDSDHVFTTKYGGKVRAANRQTVDKILKSVAKKHGIEKLSAHMFRHSHASHALQRGSKIHVVRDTLGHSSIAITNNYTHVTGLESSATSLVV